MDKLKMHTPDKTEENFRKLARLFPNAVTETIDENGKVVRAIDKGVLMQEISAEVVEGAQERYQFTWPDKKKSVILANQPIAKTLRLDREKSVGRDGTAGSIDTENIYIEGDNLDALKLLQETYLGKVKMIYIDPPYNTGSDAFVYDDDFSLSGDDFAEVSGQYDEDGNLLFDMRTNSEGNGRFHTDWLNMLYPRLRLAKDLLKDDGVIFISIDKREQHNLRKMCDEIFGAENFISDIAVVNNLKGRSDDKYIATAHENLLIYKKPFFETYGVSIPDEYVQDYKLSDEKGRYRLQGLRKRGAGARREDRPNMYYPFYYNESSGVLSLQPTVNAVEILPKLSDGSDGRWRWGIDTAKQRIDELTVEIVSGRNEYDVFQKDYLDANGEKRVKPKSVWTGAEFSAEAGTLQTKALLGKGIFETPKSVDLIKYCLEQSAGKDDIIVDFFSGSATTAHAVMQLNAEDEDGGKRKFILVQLPEPCDEKSEAYKAGYKNICEIGEERIRRAGRKILDEYNSTLHTPNSTLDVGFRVFKVDSTNMEDVYYKPADYNQGQLNLFADNIKPDRTPEDLLFQVMLDLGILLSSKIEQTEIAGKKVFSVADGYLIACFDKDVTEETVTEIAKRHPFYAVFRDSGMASDSVMTNFEQIFETYSPNTQRKVL